MKRRLVFFLFFYSMSFLMIACEPSGSSGEAPLDDPLEYKISNAVQTQNITYKEFKKCEDAPEQILCNLTLSVHTSLKYGKGPAGPATAQDIVDHGYGNCGHFAFILRDELEHLNISSETISVFSSAGAIHAIVEIKTAGQNYLADPTLGLLYHQDFISTVMDPQLSYNFSGRIPHGYAIYGGYTLFQSLDFFILYEDTTYTLNPQALNNISTSTNQISIDLEAPKSDIVTINFQDDFSFSMTNGVQFNYSFPSAYGQLGIHIPTRNRNKIQLQFKENIQPAFSGGTLQVTGNNL